MAPIRRYLRITKQSILEVRIYLDNPADAPRWLLHAREPALPRVIAAVRPYVLPKLREENERNAKGKPGKRRGVKDVVVEDDFEVSIFLTEISTRHSVLTRRKRVRDQKPRLFGSAAAGRKMTGATALDPMDVDDAAGIRDEEDDGGGAAVDLRDIPPVQADDDAAERREGLFVSDGSSDDDDTAPGQEPVVVVVVPDEDKKKLAMETSYEGFSIYGRILCLVVKRKGVVKGKVLAGGTGQAMMESFITSTQAAKEGRLLED